MHITRFILQVILVSWVLILVSCANAPPSIRDDPPYVFSVTETDSQATQYAPAFIPSDYTKIYNRIGNPVAHINTAGTEQISIDPTQPVFFFQQQHFQTITGGQYRNLIYRVHFERVPFRLLPFNITAGKNGGLFIVITLNKRGEPVLITTVHTCGCYLAIIPTNFLPAESIPINWNSDQQHVYGERLPGLLQYPVPFDPKNRLVIYLRGGTHRVMDMAVLNPSQLKKNYQLIPSALKPIDTLKKLKLPSGEYTSFYHDSRRRQGYVKNAFKPLELLLMSWWAFDLDIGSDKELGDYPETGTVFYTSLKPWDRYQSDMWRFADFLSYWGWRL